MSHYVALVLINAPTLTREQAEQAVKAAIGAYDEDLETEPRRIYLDPGDMINMAEHYKVPCEPSALMPHVGDWHGIPGALDERGDLYYMTTRNENGRWDWWQIGGRWTGWLAGYDPTTDPYDRDVFPVREIASGKTPHAVVTPDGEWHEAGRMGLFATVHDEKAEELWTEEVNALLAKYQDCIAVAVDCHI